MIEKSTVTFKREEIIAAMQDYYNRQCEEEETSKAEFYQAEIYMDEKNQTIELQIKKFYE